MPLICTSSTLGYMEPMTFCRMTSCTCILTNEALKKCQLDMLCGITNSTKFKEESMIRTKYDVKFNDYNRIPSIPYNYG